MNALEMLVLRLAKLERTVERLAVLEAGSGGGGTPDTSTLNVQELDGTPDVDGVVSIIVDNGLLTNVGAGVVRLTSPTPPATHDAATEGPGIDLVGQQVGLGGDTVLTYHANGNPVSEQAATAAGLIAALAAAASGDTVWLPSIEIALTQAITVPASVSLRGFSHNALLSFSGFSTAAIVLSAGSMIEGFTLEHTDGIGFDASAEGAIALNLIVTADLPATAGVERVEDEIWIAVEGPTEDVVAWSNYSRAGSRVWNLVAALPSGTPIELAIADDGSTLYLMTDQDDRTLYKCTNPKAAIPIWTAIAYVGLDTGLGGSLSTYFSYTMGPMTINGTIMSIGAHYGSLRHWAYGEYNGSEWTWNAQGSVNSFRNADSGFDSWADPGVSIYDGSHHLIETITSPSPDPSFQGIWHRAGQPRYIVLGVENRVVLRIVGVTNIDLGDKHSITSNVSGTRVRGAHQGVQVYVVAAAYSTDNGGIWLSDDGTTFTKIATWRPGWIEDDQLAGGGNLLVFAHEVDYSVDDTIGRIYDRAGNIADDLTGDFWSLVTHEDKTIVGLGVVYD
jgi:hypothetical protein